MNLTVEQGAITDIQAAVIMLGIFAGDDGIAGASRAVDRATSGMIKKITASGDFTGELYRTVLVYKTRGIKAERVLLVGLGKRKEFTLDRLRGAASSGARFIREMGLKQFLLPLSFVQLSTISSVNTVRALVEGIFLGLYAFDEFKTDSEKKKKKVIESCTILAENRQELVKIHDAAHKARALAEGVYLARDLVSRPANSATPTFIAHTAQAVAKRWKLTCRVLGKAQVRKLGMGCFLGVAQGSREPARFIILDYVPKKARTHDTVVIVGKAITFDSGGISLKPPQGMERMKDDMAGGAAVLGILQTVAQLALPVHVVGIVPATENVPDGAALKPGDVITSMSGKTVEIISTDAEGRLILADALIHAKHYKPAAIIDLATLTGACITALGNDVAGMMGTDEHLMKKIKAASEATGEKVWQLPLWEEYGELLKSEIADIKNVGGRDAGAITGGYFLKEFAGDIPWVHLDIAGPVWTEKDKPYIPKGATGFGVRLLVNVLENWRGMKN